MCLDRVTNKNLKKTSGFGWKVFSVKGKNLHSECYARTKPRKQGIWLRAKRFRTRDYITGFHVFKNKRGAKEWLRIIEEYFPGDAHAIRKVEYRSAHTEGSLVGMPVVVAAEMKILPD